MRIPGHVFRRHLKGELSSAVRAAGVWIEDDQGRRFIDASGGAVVVNLGHGREEIARAVFDQIMACHYAHPTMFTTPPVEELAAALAGHAPPGIDRFYFMSGGGEAVETAVKLARQIHLERGEPRRYKLIARWKSYHGLTLGALAASGKTALREPFLPLLADAVHIPAPYCLRCAYGLTPPGCAFRCALALDEAIGNLGPGAVSAFLAETVCGTTVAIQPPPQGYWPLIREICDRHGVILIADEIMCAMGRAGRWFASEDHGFIPDIVTIGKGLSGGAMALSAVGVKAELFGEIVDGSGAFVHGGTFSHHPVAAAAGLAAVRVIEREGLIERVAKMGVELGRRLTARLADHPHVAEVRGVGFMWGVELVADKSALTPYPRREKVTERVWEALFDQGVLVYQAPGLAGPDGDGLVISPPFVISEQEMNLVIDAVGQAVEEVLGS